MHRFLPLLRASAAALLLLLHAAPAAAAEIAAPPAAPPLPEPVEVRVRGVGLHYVALGEGEPVVFVHGTLADYRELLPTAELLADGFRVITYSRRYNHPNEAAPMRSDHSAKVAAEDLAALISELDLGPVHLVGSSYGAYAALLATLRHPRRVLTLTLAEPPIFEWLDELPGGEPLAEEFWGMWTAAGDAFRAGEDGRALRVAMDYFAGDGAYDEFPPEVRAEIEANLRELEALTTSRDAFPAVHRAALRRLDVPVLLLGGGRSSLAHHRVDEELRQQLPFVRRLVIPGAGHVMCSEQPAACADAIRPWIRQVLPGRSRDRP